MNTKPIPVRGSGSPQASRLISARAGKTSGAAPRNHRGTAHPGVCGENSTIVGMASAKPGSSPRVRGKPHRNPVLPVCDRLIPARAGKTGKSMLLAVPVGAHPRACGENVFMQADNQRLNGSSPRVRGKPGVGDDVQALGRLIPARAGKTTSPQPTTRARAAHPRACGENLDLTDPASFPLGSSPRVRGKPTWCRHQNLRSGLIPARAGKTLQLSGTHVPMRAHPRACGENLHHWSVISASRGSSPRVRGKPTPISSGLLHTGLIPARAGKTRQVDASQSQ